MTDIQIFEPDGRAIAFAVEGEGPVSLVLLPEDGLDTNALAVISHYLVEEAGFHVVRIGVSSGTDDAIESSIDGVEAVLAHIGLEHTWIGGHGAGGTIARAFAAAHTDRTNGLLLLGVQEQSDALAPLIPVLIIQGTDDDITPIANGERLQATAPERASIKTVEGAGHLFPQTHPIETAFIIEEYLDWD